MIEHDLGYWIVWGYGLGAVLTVVGGAAWCGVKLWKEWRKRWRLGS